MTVGLEGVEVLAVDHVGIAVPDLDAAIEFYRSALGLVEVHREPNIEHQIVEVMLAPASQSDLADPASRPAQVQLLAPMSEDSAIATFIDTSGPGLQQIAFRVADLDRASDQLRARGLRLLYPAPSHGTQGSKINFIHPKDTGGVLIELVQPDATGDRGEIAG